MTLLGSSIAGVFGRPFALLFGCSLLVLTPPAWAAGAADYVYISPLPGARWVSPRTQITLRPGGAVEGHALASARLAVVGTVSGAHEGEWILTTDRRTVLFRPYRPFTLGERVEVGLGRASGELSVTALPPLAFDFTVASADPSRQPPRSWEEFMGPGEGRPGEFQGPENAAPSPSIAALPPVFTPWDTLPPGYADIRVVTHDHPAPGCVFITPFSFSPGGGLYILDNYGMPIFYRRTAQRVMDFKRQPNGLLTYFDGKFRAMDDTYTVVDSFETGNGYVTDGHDLQILPNGHALLMSYDPQPFPMDSIVPGGRPDAVVIGLIVQELDADKNVVFEWRSWDHFQVTDMTAPNISLTDPVIDYVHGNAVELDGDGNLLVSSRNLSEITKIDRQTGDVIWRMGLNAANNEFTFIDDTRGFSGQHDIRRIANGNITIFDNGNYIDPLRSRAIEYRVNEQQRTARLVWEHRNDPDSYGPFMGNTQRLAGGGTMICWGGTSADPKLTEVDASGSPTFEIGFNSPGLWSYRAFRFDWQKPLVACTPHMVGFGVIDLGEDSEIPLTIENTCASELTITRFASTDRGVTVEATLPITLAPGASVTVQARYSPRDLGACEGNIYVRCQSDDELMAQGIPFWGVGTASVDVAGGAPGLTRLLPSAPNPFRDRTSVAFDLARDARVALTVFDVHGRKIETLIDGWRPAGRHQEVWDGRGVASGLYFFELVVEDRILTRKVVRTK